MRAAGNTRRRSPSRLGGHRLAAEGDLLEHGRRLVARRELGQQEPPVRRRGAGVRDVVLAQRGQAALRPARYRGDQRGAGRRGLQDELEAAELVQAVGEQPALPGRGLDLAERPEQPGPVVPHALGRAGRAGGEDQHRRRLARRAIGPRGAPDRKGIQVHAVRTSQRQGPVRHDGGVVEPSGQVSQLLARGAGGVDARLGPHRARCGQQGEEPDGVVDAHPEASQPALEQAAREPLGASEHVHVGRLRGGVHDESPVRRGRRRLRAGDRSARRGPVGRQRW